MSGYHSLIKSQAKIGHNIPVGAGYGYHPIGYLRPMIKVHPETGKKSLFIARHIYKMDGLNEQQTEELLEKLTDEACQGPRVYTHKWSAGDVVIWDNR
jgi:alpha-ketoglutarate-dependent taurine dioxygenase